MNRRSIVAALAVAAAVAAGAAAVALHYLRPAQLVAAVAGKLKQSTGRELVVTGATGIKLFPRPAIVLEDVRFGNAAWASQPWMATVGRAEAEMQWGPLLRGEIDIASIHLAGAALLLETDAAGNGNWVMGAPDSAPVDLSWLAGFAVAELRIEPFAVAYRDGATGNTTRVALETVTLEAPPAPQPIRFQTHGRYSGKRFEAQGSIGALAALLAGDRPYPLTLSATSGNSKLEISGEAGQPSQLAGLSLDVSAHGAALADLEVLFPRALGPWLAEHDREGHLPGLAYSLGWHLVGNWNAFSLSGMNIVVGDPERMEIRIGGSMEFRQAGSGPIHVPAMDLELRARGREIKEFLALAGESIPAAGPYDMSANASGPWGAAHLSNIRIEMGHPERVLVTARGAIARPNELRGIDLTLAARAVRPWRIGETDASPLLPPFRLKTRLRDRAEGYALDDLELEVAESKVDAAIVATRSGGRLRVSGRAASRVIDLARVLGGTEARATSRRARTGKGSESIGLPALLDNADVDLDLQLGRLVLPDGQALTGITGRLGLRREGLAISSGRLTAAGASIRVEGRVAEPAQGSGIDLRLAIQGDELANLIGFAGMTFPPVGPYQATATAQGSLDALRLAGINAQAGKPGQAQWRAKGQIANAMKGEGLDLTLAADIADPDLPSRLAGRELPRLPRIRLSAHFTNPSSGYALDDLRLAVGKTALQGRLAWTPAEPRPRIVADLTGAKLDLSEIGWHRGGGKAPQGKDGDPLKAADLDVEFRLDRLVLPDKRALGPVAGRVLLNAGAAELRKVAVSVGGASAEVEGTVANLLEPEGLALAVKAEVKDTTALAALLGKEIPKLPPFTGSGKLSGGGEAYAVSGLKLVFAATTVSGDLGVTRAASRYKLRATLASPLLDLSETLPDGGSEPAHSSDGRLFSNAALPFASLRIADADLDLKVEELRLRGFPPLGPVAARVALAGGHLQAEPVRVGAPGSPYIEFSGTVDAQQGKKPRLALRAEGKAIDLGAGLSRVEKAITVSGAAADFKLDLAARGNSLRSLMARLNGRAWISVGPGRIHHATPDLGTGVILRVLDLVNPFRKTEPDTEMKCLAINVPIAAGVIKSERSIAAETAKFNAVASGTIDLGTETLALAVTPVASQGIALGTGQILHTLSIGGTLRKPDFGMDMGMAGTAKSAVSIYADVVTAGGWLVADALLKKVMADPNPCATALAESR